MASKYGCMHRYRQLKLVGDAAIESTGYSTAVVCSFQMPTGILAKLPSMQNALSKTYMACKQLCMLVDHQVSVQRKCKAYSIESRLS